MTHQGRNKGMAKGDPIPRTPNHWGAPKSPNNVASTFFNTTHLLPRDLKFEYGVDKLFFAPGAI